ncbi:uncharacterized protein PG998_007407 [Apiospora kogelbergensis]|uniref:Uncharacterized protein n=1 Tax=Apiospora kogelbergensis TaxID=1337665 RepID=A0AAW0QHH4_9PEZI
MFCYFGWLSTTGNIIFALTASLDRRFLAKKDPKVELTLSLCPHRRHTVTRPQDPYGSGPIPSHAPFFTGEAVHSAPRRPF